MRILLVVLEFPLWLRARQWSYAANIAVANGLEALGVETVILPAFYGMGSDDTRSWLSRTRDLLSGEFFDQVWLWTLHNEFKPEFLDFLITLAPVRIGWLGENLFYTPQEHALSPELHKRKENFMKQVGALTHVLVAADECEVEYLKKECLVPAIWWPTAVPLCNIRPVKEPAPFNQAVFCGFPYGMRKQVLQDPNVSKVLMTISPPENAYSYPDDFNDLCDSTMKNLSDGNVVSMQDLNSFSKSLNVIRQNIFNVWQDGLARYSLIVNLPSYGKCYTSRVVEAIAAGRPVLAWRVPDRPRNAALFKEGKEIFLYDSEKLDDFADYVLKILGNQDLMLETAANAQQKVLQYHTTEIRVKQVLDWVDTGVEPVYSDTESKETYDTVLHQPRERENDFYINLFTRNEEWSSAEANADELSRWAFIEDSLKQVAESEFKFSHILEVGSGRGWLAERVSKYGNYVGVEPVAAVVKHARALYPNAQFLIGDINALADNDTYDVIIATEVLEHIPYFHQANFVKDIYLRLNPGGFAIITTPRAELFYTWKHIVKPQPIEHWLSESSVKRLFSINGFTSLTHQKIYKTMPKVYAADPNKSDFIAPDQVPLYQGWLFKK